MDNESRPATAQPNMSPGDRILLFPQEHQDLLSALHRLNVESKTFPQLQSFLQQASARVHAEVSALGNADQNKFGIFEDLVELVENHAKAAFPNPVVQSVLQTTVQIGDSIIIARSRPSILSAAADRTRLLLGIGSGLIVASIVATARSLDDLIVLGLEGIAFSCHLTLALERVSQCVDSSDGPWSMCVRGNSIAKIESELESVNAQMRPMQQAYIGLTTRDRTVVFGPPSTLKLFTSLSKNNSEPSATSRILLHGSHLPSIDVDAILGDASLFDSFVPHSSLHSAHVASTSTAATSLRHLLCTAVRELIYKKIDIEGSIKRLCNEGLKGIGRNVALTTIGSTWITSEVLAALEGEGFDVHLDDPLVGLRDSVNDPDDMPTEAIAVVGMAGRFPESETLDELWHLLESGTTTHREIPSDRFDVDEFYDPTRKSHNALLARFGCFLKKPGDFDHRLFNISPREAMQMDPVQRMLLMTTYESLEMAGYAPKASINGVQPLGRIATYFGQTIDDWKTIIEQHGIDTHFLPGVNRGFAPGRLNHIFKWAGGFHSIDTGCSSSATGICLARNALISRECDAAVVGGGTLLTAPEWFAGLSQGGFLSPTGACKTYTDQADGYCRGEGVAVVVLKRLSDAIREKDNVLAVLAGASRNSNAGEGSITHPGEHAQEALYRRVLRQAAVRPQDVNVVEMHGTGTQAGDRTETTVVRNVFAPVDGPKRAHPVVVGALKANIGHSEAAAGVVSLIKAILMLNRDTIPVQPNQDAKLNSHLTDILGHSLELANGQRWPRSTTNPRYVFINNFDAAGGNVSMLIRDMPQIAPPSVTDNRSHHVVVTSGRTTSAHSANKDRLREYLVQHPDTDLASLGYTTTARRMHHAERSAFAVTSIKQLIQHLESSATASAPTPAKSTVFTFTGQGAQHVGMGGLLYRTFPTFRSSLDSYQNFCTSQGLDCNFISVICGEGIDSSTTSATQERDLQVATVALEIALAHFWQGLGLQPTLLVGHSLGEYAALCVAGVLSVGDALALAYERASLIFSRCQPSEANMLAVALPATTVQYRVRDSAATGACEVTCFNGPSSTVVGGPVAAIDAFEDYLKSELNVATTRLRVHHAFHTRQMDPILSELEAKAAKVCFHSPKIAIASTLLGRIVKPGEEGVFNPEYIRRHTREPVAFTAAIAASESEGLITDQSLVYEIGPHPICINLMASCLHKVKPKSFASLRRGKSDWESIAEGVAGAHRSQVPIAWGEYHIGHLDSVRLISDLPTYAFDLQKFWLVYQSQHAHVKGEVSSENTGSSSSLSTTTLQSVEQVSEEGTKLIATFSADLSNRQLSEAIGGHVVDGVAICPASIFIDMAYTASAYLEKKSRHVQQGSVEVPELVGLVMSNPLVLREGQVDLPRIIVEASLDRPTDTISIRFRSRTTAGTMKEHGSSSMRLNQPSAPYMQSWARMQSLVHSRVNSLDAAVRSREVHAMDKKLFYKVFSEIVDYAPPYHAVKEATISPDFRDASFILQLEASAEAGNFTCNPFAVDAMVHVAGFLLNADVSKPKDVVHIANHIGSLQVFDEISPSGVYQVYATIREKDTKAGTSFCDVYLTHGYQKLVAQCTDICFKKLDRDFFALLTGSNRSRVQHTAASPPHRSKRPSPAQLDSGTASPKSSRSSSVSLSSASDQVDLAVEMFDAIATHSGIDITELKQLSGKNTFSDMGLDSQMSIVILADFRKSTGVELPAAFFTNFPTPAAVQEELASQQDEEFPEPPPRRKNASPAPKKRNVTKQVSSAKSPSQHLLQIISDALGLDSQALTPATSFDSMGMDSMLSLKILALFQQETHIELPAAFFNEFTTVGAAQDELDEPVQEEDEQNAAPTTDFEAKASAASRDQPAKPSARQQKLDNAVSRAVLIQGKSRSTLAPLFMTTDGSGTVESYIHLTALPDGRRIYGLESPFLEVPEHFDLSIEEMATIFIRTIRRIQPHGPYLIGGWSAGSMYAYEVARRLTTEGETILALVILDMRAPSLIPTSIVTTDFVDKLGTFEGINRARDLPEDLTTKERDHLMATCRALSRYDAPDFPTGRQPNLSVVVWARLGLDNRPDAPRAAMRRPGVDIGKKLHDMTLDEFERYFNSWFYGRRDQFGTNGWEDLLGENISVYDVDGDHFSMMIPPHSLAVGGIVRDAVVRAVAEA